MTNSASTITAILFGLGIFAVIVAVGWRSVQNRRILRLQGSNGQETIIVAGEDDEISSVATTTETERRKTVPAAALRVEEVHAAAADVDAAPEFGRKGRL
jgi:hypothetical protein